MDTAVNPGIYGLQGLRSLRIGVRLTLCFIVMVTIIVLGGVPAIWQMNFYNSQVERLSSIDRRMISVLKVNKQVLAFRELMLSAAANNDADKVRVALVPFRAKFLQDVAEASAALNECHTNDRSLQRTIYTLLSYQTAIPGEIDAMLELAKFQDWQAIHFRLNKQILDTSRVLSNVVGEIETEANAERRATVQTMTEIRYRVMGILPMCCLIVLLTSGALIGVRVTRSIAEPLSHLEEGAQALGSGNFSYRLDVDGKDELATVAVAFNTAAAQIEQLHSGLETLVAERTADLRQANESLQRLSSLDPLTGIANRRTFARTLEQELRRSKESGRPVSLLMIDVDHFKGLNDAYGHQKGDECLIKVVLALQSVPLRVSDLIARYGGEEFAVVLPDTDMGGATAVAEKMRAAVEQQGIPNSGSPRLRVSVSIGLEASWPEYGDSLGALVEKADQALYRAKQNGRNCVCSALAEIGVLG